MKQLNYDYSEIYPINESLIGFLENLDTKIRRKPHFVEEIETILGFMENLMDCMNSFKNKLLGCCSGFQLNINKQLKYEFSMKYFQIVMNGFLKFHHKIESYVSSLQSSQNDLKKLKNKFEEEKQNLHIDVKLLQQLRTSKDEYNAATDEYLQLQENSPKEPDKEIQTQLDLKQIKSLDVFKDFRQLTSDVTQKLFQSLSNLLHQERTSRQASIDMLIDITTLFSDNDFTIQEQFDYLKKNLSKTPLDLIECQNQIKSFQKVESSFNLEKPLSGQKALDKYYISFLEIQKFLKEQLDENSPNIKQPNIYYIKNQIQIFYQNQKNQAQVFAEVTKKILQQNAHSKRYFLILLIDQKSHMTYMSPFSRYNIKEHQVLFLQNLFEFLYTKQSQKDIDSKLNFLLIRVFQSFYYNDIQVFSLFKDCPVLLTENFWLNHYRQNIQINSQLEGWERNLQGLQKKSSLQFLDTLSNFWSNKKEIQLTDKIFKGIMDLTFRIPMTIEQFFYLLQKLQKEIKDKQFLVQDFLSKKHRKILVKVEKEVIESESKRIKLNRNIDFNYKLRVVIKNVLKFFDSAKETFYLCLLSKNTYNNLGCYIKQQILISQLKNKNLRKQIFVSFIGGEKEMLKLKQIKNAKTEKIINLDIQRTMDYRSNKKGKRLQLILLNICDENGGNFNYFQGLNYLANYFFLLFSENEIQTYNFVIYLMKQNYYIYTQKDFQNMKILFFIQSKLIEKYLPKISQHFDKIDLNCDVFLPGWYLTIFTTILHQQKSSQVLDDIIDIFVAEGWQGFFKIVLVILQNCQEDILQKDQDDNMIYFSDMNKKGFINIEKQFEVNGIKEQIIKFKEISQDDIIYYTRIYDQVAQKLKKLKKKFGFQNK